VRTLLRIRIDTEAGNRAITNGTVQRALKELADTIHPEAAYFLPDEGERTALFVFDMQDSSAIPAIVEPLFLTMNASVALSPVMNFDDLEKGLAAISS
jgi:hypothetical protein